MGYPRKVLLLNASYEPLCTVTTKRAVVLVWQGEAEVLSSYETEQRSGNFTMPSPCVIRLVRFRNVPRMRKAYMSRRGVVRRDNSTCCYCGKVFPYSDLTIDHVMPRSRGGPNTWKNVVACCFRCNQKKGDRTPEEMGWRMRFTPYEPTGSVRLFIASGNTPEQWEEWLK